MRKSEMKDELRRPMMLLRKATVKNEKGLN